MKQFILLSCLAVSLTACSGVRETIGLNRTPPDEFKVVKRAPLEVPDQLTLPPPRPGAPRPQELAVPVAAKQALVGEVQEPPRTATQGEAALLRQTGADEAEADIRARVDEETAKIQDEEQSVTQKLLGFGGLNKPDGVLDAEEEAQRLEKTQHNQ